MFNRLLISAFIIEILLVQFSDVKRYPVLRWSDLKPVTGFHLRKPVIELNVF